MKTIIYLQTLLLMMVFATVRSQPGTLQSEQQVIEISEHSAQLNDALKVIIHQKAALDDANKRIAKLEVEPASATVPPVVEIVGFTFDQQQVNIFLLSLCGFFALISVIVFVKFRSANVLTVLARESLTNLEDEHQEHLRISLEREQKLRRQLQDEINRHKISKAS